MAVNKLIDAGRYDYAVKLGGWYCKKLNDGGIKSDYYSASILSNLSTAYYLRGQLEERIEVERKITNLPDNCLDKVSRILASQSIFYTEFLLTGDKRAVAKLRKLNVELKHLEHNPVSILKDEDGQYDVSQVDNARKIATLGLVSSYFKLGYINHALRRYSRAERNYKIALSLSRNVNGLRHVVNSYSQQALVEVYLQAGKHEEAQELCNEVLEMRRRFRSKNSLELANTLLTLGKLHLIHGRLKEAEKCFSRVERNYQRVNKQFRYLDMPFLWEAQAALEYKRGNYGVSLDLISKAVSELETMFAPLHPLSLSFLELESKCLRKLGLKDDAFKIESKIAEIRKQACIKADSQEYPVEEAA